MASSTLPRFFFALCLLLLSNLVIAQACNCKVERVNNQTVFSAGCEVPEQICSLEVGSGVNEVDLRRFTDLRGIHIKLGNNIQPTFLGSALSNRQTKFIAVSGVSMLVFDEISGQHLSLQSGAGNKPNGIKAYNKNIGKCFGDCSLISPAAAPASSSARSSAMVLPVTLISWEAASTRQGVRLDWETEQESDNDYFVVLRSRDGERFEEVARVTGNGSTERSSAYRLFDPAAREGLTYYQLVQVDFDGTRTVLGLRQVRVINSTTAPLAGMSPNPAGVGSEVTVHLSDAAGTPVRIVDLTGRTLAATSLDAGGRFRVPATLRAGVYVVQVRDQATRLVVRP